jgi:multiple sugar transport system ATP-binding protein
VVVRAAEHEILAVFRERHAFQPGQQITLRPDVASANLFEASGGTRLH